MKWLIDEPSGWRRLWHSPQGVMLLVVILALGAVLGQPLLRAENNQTPRKPANPENAMVREIAGADNFKQSVLDQAGTTLVDFYATWCGPCKQYSPIVEKVASEKPEGVHFVKIDVDKSPDVARQYGVDVIPTTILFKEGKPVQRFVGVQSEETLKKALGVK